MIKYPLFYNPILEYWEQMRTGKITVCRKIYKTFEYLSERVLAPLGDYRYSPSRANHAIEFIENFCHHSKGEYGGKPVSLELWEKAILATVFGFINESGHRQYRECFFDVAKKNGKSLISSGIGLYMQIADNEPGAEVYAVATKRDQAGIIWKEAKRMVNKSPLLRKYIKPLVSELVGGFNDSSFKPLASDSDTLDGLNVHCALMDEIHQWRNGRELYDIIADGTISRRQPLVMMTTTAGVVRADIYDEMYDYASRVINGYGDPDGYRDEHFIAFVYELDNRDEWQTPSAWVKANPGLGTIKPFNKLADKVAKAQANPSLVRNLLCKEFNIPQTSMQSWLSFEDIDNRTLFDVDQLRPLYGIGGADLSKTTDLTAAKVIFRVPNDINIYVLSMYWLPEDLLERRVREDKIPYDKWCDRGLLRLCPGNTIHPKYVTEWFVDIQEQHDIYIPWIGYDAWSASYWVEEMQGYFGENSMIAIQQGKKTLSAPMQTLGSEFAAHHIIYNDNPIDKWCFANTAIDEDKNGNIQPCKTSKTTKRIDGLAALLNAFVVYTDKQGDYEELAGI